MSANGTFEKDEIFDIFDKIKIITLIHLMLLLVNKIEVIFVKFHKQIWWNSGLMSVNCVKNFFTNYVHV